MKCTSVLFESNQIQLAIELVGLGARLQVLESEVKLSREKLLRLYKEVKKESPPKGMLPFSTEWFMTWQPNIHGSLFLNFYEFMIDVSSLSSIRLMIKAYHLYLDHCKVNDIKVLLSFTRAWTLIRFYDAGMLALCSCKKCGGKFIIHRDDMILDYVCGLCDIPSRAGKKNFCCDKKHEERCSA